MIERISLVRLELHTYLSCFKVARVLHLGCVCRIPMVWVALVLSALKPFVILGGASHVSCATLARINQVHFVLVLLNTFSVERSLVIISHLSIITETSTQCHYIILINY